MVMETPSPQCVGREFVRQYYTLLHEAPIHLHRFYSNQSSFVHGGVDRPGDVMPPVMGQSEIHKKILSLNFRDCHAKIRQVDSQATVGEAVVVQVTGELSNNGQPMRRFMQTFVLVPQSPKKYYVHNDIFRYQDEVFHDIDTDNENVSDGVDSEHEVVDAVPSEDGPMGGDMYEQAPVMQATQPVVSGQQQPSSGRMAVKPQPVPVSQPQQVHQPPQQQGSAPTQAPQQAQNQPISNGNHDVPETSAPIKEETIEVEEEEETPEEPPAKKKKVPTATLR